MSDQPSTAKFIRTCLLKKPDLTPDDLHKMWAQAGMPAAKKPDPTLMHGARYGLKHKYGVTDVKLLPRLPDGAPDVKGLAGLLLKKHGLKTTFAQIKHYLNVDGVVITEAQFNEVRAASPGQNAPAAKAPTPDPKPSPDPNQTAGPRARKPDEHGRGRPKTNPPTFDPKTVAAATAGADKKVAAQYHDMEDELDALIGKARTVLDSELVERLKQVRRHVIVRASNLVG